MRKPVVLMIIFLLCYVSDNFALVVTNKCGTCSFIDLDLNGYSDENEYVYFDGNLGGYNTSLTWSVPAGEYNFYALCEAGTSKGFIWIDFLTLTGSALEDQHNLYCPPPDTTSTSSTTTTTSSFRCLSEEIYGEDSIEIELLRYFRDYVLIQTLEGQEIIKLYYQWSSVIVEMMEEDEEFKAQVKEMMKGMVKVLDEAEEGK